MSSKSDLILSLMEKKGFTLDEAKAFAEEFFEEHPEPTAHHVIGGGQVLGHIVADPSAAIPMLQGVTRASGLPIPAINQQGLKAAYVAAAVAAGAQMCPNCQQAAPDHLPGCARVDMGGNSYAADRKAITKDPLPPVSR